FSQWLGGVKSLHAIADVQTVGSYVADKAPPGVSGMLVQSIDKLKAAISETFTGLSVRGEAHIQISAPWISLLRGMDIMVHVFVRAHYFPDKDSHPLPEPIHGEVQIVYRITPVTLSTGKKVLRVPTPPDDSAIQFISKATTPALSGAEVDEIAAEIRK